ncbi:putative membrane protein, partial [Helicobacter pylori Hp H-24b]
MLIACFCLGVYSFILLFFYSFILLFFYSFI